MRVIETVKSLAASIRARVREEHGFTMVVVMGVLLVATAFSVAAIAAADNDDPQARKDTDSKQAYAAAEAGIQYYVFHLNNDNAFWSTCTHSGDTNLPSPRGLSQVGAFSASDTWRNVPGASSQFAIELLPANGSPVCDTANPQQSMIDQNSGSFRIRSTGWANGVRRSIVATFKRRGFLDYIWFTDYEIRDPLVSGDPNSCVKHIWEGRPNGCSEVNFVTGDNVQGPMHTNDQFLVCGTPTFGRSGSSDKIEATHPTKTWRAGSCGTNQPTINGADVPGAPLMSLPPSNSQLATLASGAFKPTGRTDIELRANPAKICMRPLPAYPAYWTQNATSYTCYDPPANGVLYVQSGSCGVTYDQSDPYNVPTSCGEAWVHGTYSSNLTIGADKDVVVDGDLIRSGNSMLGLIANNFVRVYHPVKSCANDTTSGSGLLGNVEVDAAILSLNHSWAVDNYGCGSSLGTLTVKGAIAQKFRGTVGTSNGATGYLKNYQYDDRLVFRSPPSFLDPVQTSWRIARYNEQLPPSTLTHP